jgi:hypothetical protein
MKPGKGPLAIIGSMNTREIWSHVPASKGNNGSSVHHIWNKKQYHRHAVLACDRGMILDAHMSESPVQFGPLWLWCILFNALLDLGVSATVSTTMERCKWLAAPKSTEVEKWHCNLKGGCHMIPKHVFDSITNPLTMMEYQLQGQPYFEHTTPHQSSPSQFRSSFSLAPEAHMISTRQLVFKPVVDILHAVRDQACILYHWRPTWSPA